MCVGALLYRVLERLWILVSRRGPGICPLWTLRGNWCSGGGQKLCVDFQPHCGGSTPDSPLLFKVNWTTFP